MQENLGTFTDLGWTPPAEPISESQWISVIETLGQRKASYQWQLGDAWRYGESKYGSRRAMTMSPEWRGPSFQTCANFALVARAFSETTRRRVVLSFSHHQEVAGLPAAEADAVLDWAVETKASTEAVRVRARELREAAEKLLPALPKTTKDVAVKVEAWISARGIGESDSAWKLRRTSKVAPDLATAVLSGKLKIARAYDISVERTREREAALRNARATRSIAATTSTNIVPLRTSRDAETSAAALRSALSELRQVCDDNYSSETLRRILAQDVAIEIEADARVALRFLANLARTWAMPELRALNSAARRKS